MAQSQQDETPKRAAYPHVSNRQRQILELAASALSDKEIAARLKLSVSTIRTHLQRFYKSNGVHNRVGAVTIWLSSRNTERDEGT